MFVELTNGKEILSFKWDNEQIKEDNPYFALCKNVDVSSIKNIIEAQNENSNFRIKYSVSLYYLDANNKLCIKTENEILLIKKQYRIKQLKELGENKVYEQAPLFKQVNASFGIYDVTKTKEIKDAITNVKTKVDTAEAEILALTSIEAVEAYDINIF